MRPNRATLTLMAVLFLVGVATAHEGERHIKGTIESVQAEVLVIRTTTGEVVPLRLGGETRYETADGMATRRDRLRAGLRVVVRASEGGGHELLASLVLLPGPAASPAGGGASEDSRGRGR